MENVIEDIFQQVDTLVEDKEPKTVDEITKEWLNKKYHIEGLGVLEIAQIFKVYSIVISAKLEEFGISKKLKGRQKKEIGKNEVVKVKTFILNGEEFGIGDKFYTVEKINSLNKDQLVEVFDIKKGEVMIRDVYTHSKRMLVKPEQIYKI